MFCFNHQAQNLHVKLLIKTNHLPCGTLRREDLSHFGNVFLNHLVAGCLDGSKIHGSEGEASCIMPHKREKTLASHLLKDLRFVKITNMTLKV